jgi:hypothetical protein
VVAHLRGCPLTLTHSLHTHTHTSSHAHPPLLTRVAHTRTPTTTTYPHVGPQHPPEEGGERLERVSSSTLACCASHLNRRHPPFFPPRQLDAIALDVFPATHKTDLKTVEAMIKRLDLAGVRWDAETFERTPVAYGIEKLGKRTHPSCWRDNVGARPRPHPRPLTHPPLQQWSRAFSTPAAATPAWRSSRPLRRSAMPPTRSWCSLPSWRTGAGAGAGVWEERMREVVGGASKRSPTTHSPTSLPPQRQVPLVKEGGGEGGEGDPQPPPRARRRARAAAS